MLAKEASRMLSSIHDGTTVRPNSLRKDLSKRRRVFMTIWMTVSFKIITDTVMATYTNLLRSVLDLLHERTQT